MGQMLFNGSNVAASVTMVEVCRSLPLFFDFRGDMFASLS
ncbi:hypothetical protein L504_5070 [Bordetella bronchiseptica F2]|uniref:Uncharacterized protein n=1 Tax=Bordetella bronchiseptica 00-P-2796 TaxID=1331199 RepID=A0ABR4RBI8_BORBO|nr:hypothetical protein L490_5328 [Bordetella bronchiseptica 00-P-2796]KDC16857.1 hypothetical protein L542_4949 [Bordetella bronchiseptica F-1]KDC32660.1 hypothetical protein L504_5070 [Bordetella bronchiseptica F2]